MSDDGGIAFGKPLAVTCQVSADQRGQECIYRY
jgi:hypothetical protein